ncbi:MAG TPA: hypothetical protein VJR89_06025 [Polyangiales bacterium]|nr:hypothetical protein [Polyangiales bacterium]
MVGTPAANEALPAVVWQSVDVVFRRKQSDRNARITVVYKMAAACTNRSS